MRLVSVLGLVQLTTGLAIINSSLANRTLPSPSVISPLPLEGSPSAPFTPSPTPLAIGFHTLSTTTNTVSTPIPSPPPVLQCLALFALPPSDQCAHYRSHCEAAVDIPSFFPYLENYYCSSTPRPLANLLLVLLLSALFMALGVAASEFLCRNLTLLSALLGMSDNLAGTTLLALGNGSPDVFGTYSAMEVGLGSLALGEIIGAALFISSVVVGSVALVKPFTVPKKTFVRDLLFFLGGILLLFTFVLNDGYLSLLECAILVGYYFLFIVVVVCWYWNDKIQVQRYLSNKRSREVYVVNGPGFDQPTDHLDPSLMAAEIGAPDISMLGGFSIHTPLDVYHASARFREGVRPSFLQALEMSGTVRSGLMEHSTSSAGSAIALDTLTGSDVVIARAVTAPTLPLYTPYSDSDAAFAPYHDNPEGNHTAPARLAMVEPPRRSPRSRSNFRKVFCPHLTDFRSQSMLARGCAVVCLPFYLLLNLTVLVKPETVEGLQKYQRVLTTIQALLTLPTVCVFWFAESLGVFGWMGVGVVSVMVGILTFSIIDAGIPVWGETVLSVCGFATSVCWILAFAEEIIALLKTLGFIYRIDDAILGLTVFAIGNSIGDLVANWSIAKGDAPAMAMAACFAGPLLNICGVGFNGLLIIPSKALPEVITPQGYRIDLTPTLLVSGAMLVLSAGYTLVAVWRNQWVMDRTIGRVLLGFWVVPTLVSVVAQAIS